MKSLLIASAAALLYLTPVGASAAPVSIDTGIAAHQTETVLIKHGRGHGWGRGGRGHHRGWARGRGHHYGWYRGRHRGW